MKLLSKFFIYLLIMVIVVQTLSFQASAETDTHNESYEGIIYGERLDDTVNYFKDEGLLELTGTIEYKTNVRVLEERETATLVEFIYYEEEEIKYNKGFVEPQFVLPIKDAAHFEEYMEANEANLSDFIEFKSENQKPLEDDEKPEEEPDKISVEENEYNPEEELLEGINQGTVENENGNLDQLIKEEDYITHEEGMSQSKEKADKNLDEMGEVKSSKESNIHNQDENESPSNDESVEAYTQILEIEGFQLQEKMYGLALLEKTTVYSETSRNSTILRSYSQGHLLEFRPHNDEWYGATVYLNGKATDGFIHRNDVDPLIGEEVSQQNYALKQPTQVYTNPSRSGEVLRGYQAGHLLKYRTYSSTWHIATVYINGEPKTGFIHADDVGPRENIRLRGVALSQPTSVYSGTSRNSTILRSYSQGHILEFRPYNNEWYGATVNVNGKWEDGFIHRNDVDSLIGEEKNQQNYALKQPTQIYTTPSRSGEVLRGYQAGHLLKYRTFSSTWHIATVYINGESKIGYIHADDVGPRENIRLRGVALNQPTSVYSGTSRNSTILRSYSQGHILEFRTHNNEWYGATVNINGKWENGFINKKDVDLLDPIEKQQTGLAKRGSTNVYSSPSIAARTLRSYEEGHILQYRNFSANWYEATVYLNGKATLGYIHKNHVNSIQGKRIVLDPGHGGNDPGAIANGLIEKNLNLDIALKTKDLLERAGATVIMTRTTDTFITLQNRALIANTSNADIFISIHNNAFNGIANGTETFWHGRNERANSIKLANSLQNAVVTQAGTTHRRVDEGNFHVIRETLIPSALLEVAFMDHLGDAEKLKQQSFLQNSAKGILIGITNYFN